MVFETFIRYAGLAVGLKPSARGCEGRLRGLYRIISSKTISKNRSDAVEGCGEASPPAPLFPPAAARRPGATPTARPPRAGTNRLVDPSPPEGDRVTPIK